MMLGLVYTYLVGRPQGTTARAVAREVLGGTGEARTTERTYASRSLRELEAQGLARRVAVPRETYPGWHDLWFAVGAES